MDNKTHIQRLKENYINKTHCNFGEVVGLEDISIGLNITDVIENFLDEYADNKFKIELLMMPSWASKSKVYKIFGEYYTHMRIKKDF